MENIIKFTKDEPLNLSPLYGAQGETYRFLLEKTALQGKALENVQLAIAKKDRKGNVTLYNLEDKDNFIRPQESDKYYQLDLMICACARDRHKQFGLIRPNGKILLGTHKSDVAGIDNYIDDLIKFYESYPYTRVDAFKKGNIVRLHIYQNDAMRINSEKLTVGLGEVTDTNPNTPALVATLIDDALVVPDEYVYNIAIQENINEGNVFRIGDVSYTATNVDTPETIIKALGYEDKKLIVRSPNTPDISAENGFFTVNNTNTATITFTYLSTNAQKDRYTITINGALNGNEFNILYQTGSTGWRIVSGLSTTYTINDWIADTFYTPSTNYFEVPQGSVLSTGFRRGSRSIENENNPSFELSVFEFKPSRTVKAYQINVSSTVRRGNEYILRRYTDTNTLVSEFKYVATANDTIGTIEALIPVEVDGYFYTDTDEYALAFAVKGNPYGDENIADVQIISQPRQYIANTYVAQFKVPMGLENGVYNLVLQDKTTLDYFAVSNEIFVSDYKGDSTLIAFGGNKDEFGLQYFEHGLTQRFRLPLFLMNQKHIVSETETQNINRKIVNSLVGIQKTKTFSSRAMSSETISALLPLMKSSNVFIGTDKIKFTEITESDEVDSTGKVNLSGTVVYQDKERSNYNYLVYDENAYIEKGKFDFIADESVTHVILKADTYTKRIDRLDTNVYVPLADYSIRFFVTTPTNIKIYKNGVLIVSYDALIGLRYHRISEFVRIGQDDIINFVAESINGSIAVNDAEFNESYNEEYKI